MKKFVRVGDVCGMTEVFYSVSKEDDKYFILSYMTFFALHIFSSVNLIQSEESLSNLDMKCSYYS